MIQFKKSSPTFYRVFFSYTVLTTIITLVISITSYVFFSNNYNKEIEINNRNILQYERDSIESNIFNRIKQIYMDLSLTQTNKDILTFFSSHPVEGNHAMITNVLDFLRQYININSNIVSSISIYYPNSNMVISTSFGLKYIKPEDCESYKNTEWIDNAFQTSEQTWKWTLRSENPTVSSMSKNNIALTGAYPWSYNSKSDSAIISIYIKPEGLYRILNRLAQSNHQAFIISNDGRIIAHTNQNMIGQIMCKTNYIKSILSNTHNLSSFISIIDNDKYFISYCTLSNTSWYLVRLIPVGSFYRRSQYIQKILFAISSVTFILGLILSNIFSLKVYNPLHTLTNKVRQFVNVDNDSIGKENEYTIINGVISNLSIKLSEFKTMLDKNQPIIRYNLVTSLLNANIENHQELQEYLKLTRLNFVYPHFRTVILTFDEKALRQIPLDHQQYIKYRLINEFENYSDENQLLICTMLDNNSIGMIINAKQIDDVHIKEFINMIYSSMKEFTNIRIAAACGPQVSNPMQISHSFEQAKKLMQYRYFVMENSILFTHDILDRDNSKEKLPSDIEDKFAQSLNARNLYDSMEYVRQFIKLIHEGNYQSVHCITRLSMLCQVLLDFAYKFHYQPIDELEDILTQPMKYTWNISELEILFEKIISKLFDFIDRLNSAHNIDIINSLKIYICKNLDKNLSLDSLADVIYLNPKYLSRLFKDITGENITDYINKKRMEKASELLVNTEMTIEEVAMAVGYNNYPYFIRRFKETYGYTPKSYRMMILKQAEPKDLKCKMDPEA